MNKINHIISSLRKQNNRKPVNGAKNDKENSDGKTSAGDGNVEDHYGDNNVSMKTSAHILIAILFVAFVKILIFLFENGTD